MDVKKDISWRVYLCFLGMVLVGIVIIIKVFVIQEIEGKHWRGMANNLHDSYRTIDAVRGTIFSSDERMLSTTIPTYSLHMDFRSGGIIEDNGALFHQELDSLSYCLAALFGDKSKAAYKQILLNQYKKGSRYFLLKRKISFDQYKKLRDFPFFRLGQNTSGLIVKQVNKRINPFGLLANRTIGLYRKDAPNIGLEKVYNKYLKGTDGKMFVQRIAGGGYIPLQGYRIDPVDGKDVITTIDVNIQNIVERALKRMVVGNEAQYGTAVVMDVNSGKIKAIANLGRQADGSYYENFNYAIAKATEPGSVFKLATMIALLESGSISIDDKVDLENGTHNFHGRTMRDVAGDPNGMVSVADAFEFSSNVGMSKLAYKYFHDKPEKYVSYIEGLHLDDRTGIDLAGEADPLIKSPEDKSWSSTTLPWMAIGYEVLQTPISLLTLYNAVANDGKMMKPYLVSKIERYGKTLKEFSPTVINPQICSDSTLHDMQKLLNGVVADKVGTGHRALKNPYFKISGKTGTALAAEGRLGYSRHVYQATFVGFFPSDNPKYSCIVTVMNKPHANKIYGASVAAPVFKEIAHKLYALDHRDTIPQLAHPFIGAHGLAVKAGKREDLHTILDVLNIPVVKDSSLAKYTKADFQNQKIDFKGIAEKTGKVPDVLGMGLKDALYLLEHSGLHVNINGKGKVVEQSLKPGSTLENRKEITIYLS